MALIKCPECNKEISDKADACPHCAYPLRIKTDEEDHLAERLLTEPAREANPLSSALAGCVSNVGFLFLCLFLLLVIFFALGMFDKPLHRIFDILSGK